MPQVSYLVRQQVRTRLADPLTGFNKFLADACNAQTPQPAPYLIDWGDGSSSFWQSNISVEDLDESSSPAGTICLLYGVHAENQNNEKSAVFSGQVKMAADFELAWTQSFVPFDTEGLASATESALIQTLNAAAYYGGFSQGVQWRGLIDRGSGRLRASGPGWRQRVPFVLTFDVLI